MPDLIGLNLLLQSGTGLGRIEAPPVQTGCSRQQHPVSSTSTLQREGKERATIWGLVMVMPGLEPLRSGGWMNKRLFSAGTLNSPAQVGWGDMGPIKTCGVENADEIQTLKHKINNNRKKFTQLSRVSPPQKVE